MTALTQIHVIEGRPGMAAEGMRALVVAAGHDLLFDVATGGTCTMRARRRDSEHWTELTWSIDMARAAGLTGKDNWKKYPRAMLIARCTADLCRMVFPDVIHGFRSVEELTDLDPEDDSPARAETAAPKKTTVSRKKRATGAQTDSDPAPVAPPLPREEEDESSARSPRVPPAAPEGSGRPREPQPPPIPDDTEEVADPPHPPAASSAPDGGGGAVGASEQRTEAVPPPSPSEPSQKRRWRAQPPPGEQQDTPLEEVETGPRLASRAQLRMMFGRVNALEGLDPEDREERLALISGIIHRDLASANDLSHDEAQTVILAATSVKTAEELRAFIARTDEAIDVAVEALGAEVISEQPEEEA
jgi:hypothetical protein